MVITGKFPFPGVVNPVRFGELATPVQENVVPPTLAVKGTAAVATPEQRVCADGVLTMDGVGFMVMTKLAVVPGQLLNVGVTAILEETVVLELFAGAVHGLIWPVPLGGDPIPAALLLTQLKVAPTGLETKAGGVMIANGQTVIGLKGPTVATGCTTTCVVTGDPGQPLDEGIKV
jgi:hypothetical protein